MTASLRQGCIMLRTRSNSQSVRYLEPNWDVSIEVHCTCRTVESVGTKARHGLPLEVSP